MAYHQATIQLKSIGTAIGIKGFLGLPVNLDQVDKSIRELEDFLSSREDSQASGVNGEKGTLIMPDEGVLKNYTMREKDLWARHIESEGKAPPPKPEPQKEDPPKPEPPKPPPQAVGRMRTREREMPSTRAVSSRSM